ncbi:hypothetical protein C5C13_11545 [Clavibacter michiganensis]|nr:hypothetical protein C5C13_11545 [Clavibacter michiganensis]
MSDPTGTDSKASALRTQYFFLFAAGVAALLYGVVKPEDSTLAFIAGAAFILVGGGLLLVSLRRKGRAQRDYVSGS